MDFFHKWNSCNNWAMIPGSIKEKAVLKTPLAGD
jgi:hypothetical protein